MYISKLNQITGCIAACIKHRHNCSECGYQEHLPYEKCLCKDIEYNVLVELNERIDDLKYRGIR